MKDVHQAEDALPAIGVRHVDIFQKTIISTAFVARSGNSGPLKVITEVPRIPVWQKETMQHPGPCCPRKKSTHVEVAGWPAMCSRL